MLRVKAWKFDYVIYGIILQYVLCTPENGFIILNIFIKLTYHFFLCNFTVFSIIFVGRMFRGFGLGRGIIHCYGGKKKFCCAKCDYFCFICWRVEERFVWSLRSYLKGFWTPRFQRFFSELKHLFLLKLFCNKKNIKQKQPTFPIFQ